MDLMTVMNCPLCAALIVLAGVFAPKVAPYVGPLLSKLLGLFTPSPAPAPAPSTPTTPAAAHPILDGVLNLLMGIAQKKFPALTAVDAVQRLAVETASTHYYLEDAQREREAAKPAA